jgi:exodeoxyribonuclease VII small subunit
MEGAAAVESAEELTFEQAYQQLERVVEQLEQGDLPLDRSLELFERGMQLAKQCESQLDQAQQRVSQITGTEPEGAELTSFAPRE